MKKEEFVRRMESGVRDSAIHGVMEDLRQPPGRRPHPNLVRRSEWFNRLSEEDRNVVREVVGIAADFALFNFFCFLDGVRKLDDEDGHLELAYIGKERVVLNSPIGYELHALLSQLQ